MDQDTLKDAPADDLAGTPSEGPPRKRRGCLFYGCLSAVLVLVALALLAWFLVSRTVTTYTGEAPRPLPVITLPPRQAEALQERASAFEQAVKTPDPEEDQGPPALVLSEEEVNTLLFRENPGLQGKLIVRLGEDRLAAELSLPLDFLGLRLFKGRYLNGRAEMDVSVRNGKVFAFIDDIKVNGRPLPKALDKALKGKDLGENLHFQPETQRYIDRIKSLDVEDHRLIIRARPRPGPESGNAAPPEERP